MYSTIVPSAADIPHPANPTLLSPILLHDLRQVLRERNHNPPLVGNFEAPHRHPRPRARLDHQSSIQLEPLEVQALSL